MSVGTPRRFYLLKSQAAEAQGEPSLAAVWKAKHAAVAGEALPSDFPAKAKLATALYTTVEDVTGATISELLDQGLSRVEAAAVLAALEP